MSGERATTDAPPPYLEPTAPTRCRVCFSYDLNAEHFDTDNAAAHRIVECGDCGHKWMEVYIFDTVEPID